MNLVKFLSAVAILNLLLSNRILGQQEEVSSKTRWGAIHINGQAAFPRGDFRDEVERMGIGGGLSFTVNPFKRDFPVEFGAAFSYFHFGRSINTIEPNPGEPLEVKTAHSFFLFHGVLRFQPFTHSLVKPYADVLLGANYFEARTKENENVLVTLIDKPDPVVLEKFKDSSFSWGASLGLMFVPDETKSVHFDMKVVLLNGGKMDYIPKRSVEVSNNQLVYGVSATNTDMFLAQVGLVVVIGQVPQEY